MKKALLLTIVLLLLPCISIAQGDKLISVVEKIKVSKNVDLTKIDDYIASFMENERAEKLQDNSYRFFTEYEYYRYGDSKYKYRYAITVTPSFINNKGELAYTINSIEGEKWVCDQSQSHQDAELQYNLDLGYAKEYCKYQAKRLLSFIDSRGVEYEAYSSQIPLFYNLEYMIEQNSISYYQVIQSEHNLSKEELYRIVDNYFAYAYKDGKSVVQNRDKENYCIIGKGYYAKTHVYNNGFVGVKETYDVPHVLRIDCRDGRIRATITISDYDISKMSTSKYASSGNFTRNPVMYKPFGKESDEEMIECLNKLERRIVSQFSEIKNAIDKGLTSVDNLDNW